MSKIFFIQTFHNRFSLHDYCNITFKTSYSENPKSSHFIIRYGFYYDKINQVCTGITFILCNFNYKRMLHGSSSCGAKIHTKCIKCITLKFKKLFQIVNLQIYKNTIDQNTNIEFKNYLVTKNIIFTYSTYRVFQLEGQDLK